MISEHDAGLPADDRGDPAPRQQRVRRRASASPGPTPVRGARRYAEVAANAARLAQRAGAARRRARRPRRHVHVEHAGAPRGVPRGPVDGRGAAHAEHPPVPRAARVRRSTTARTRS